jgi:hypothetical protein
MRLWFDTEFIEDPAYPVELISIGIIREDGAEYYAEVNLDAETRDRVLAHDWLMANVVPHLNRVEMKSKAEIAVEIENFAHTQGRDAPEWWAYCGAYDWVVLNQLYGTMEGHPARWPFYCNDIAQYAMHLGISRRAFPEQHLGAHGVEHNALADARWTRDTWLWLREKEASFQ